MSPSVSSKIHRLWDLLAEYPEPQLATAGLKFLLKSVSELIEADFAYWLSSFRLEHLDAENDSLLGWRPGPVVYSRELPRNYEIYKYGVKETEGAAHEVPESTRNHVRQAGRFRVSRLRDLVSPEFFDTAHYRIFYEHRNLTDTLFVVAPVNADTEVYFSFSRIGRDQPFTENELEIAGESLRCLRWFHKKVLLGRGLLIADKVLTPTEQKVMHWLLTECSERQIAERLQQKPDTTHKHVINIYRKFNVKSRAALMAIWLGQPVSALKTRPR